MLLQLSEVLYLVVKTTQTTIFVFWNVVIKNTFISSNLQPI